MGSVTSSTYVQGLSSQKEYGVGSSAILNIAFGIIGGGLYGVIAGGDWGQKNFEKDEGSPTYRAIKIGCCSLVGGVFWAAIGGCAALAFVVRPDHNHL